MRALVQRVTQGSVRIDDTVVAAIDAGYVVLVGVHCDDTPEHAEQLAENILDLRVMSDENGRMNRSIVEARGSILVVSQFTLYADTSQGHRPSFTEAAPSQQAEPRYNHLVATLRTTSDLTIKTGQFGAMMNVEIHNDGPITLLLET